MPPLDHLARASARAAIRPGFLASRYSADQLTAALRCDRATAERLRLCRLPRPERWEADVAALAAFAGVDAGALGELLGPLAGKAG